MHNLVEYDIKGLKCDKKDCDYIDNDIEISEKLIGTNCPKCGANLLTKEAYEQVVSIKKLADCINNTTKDKNIDTSNYGLITVTPTYSEDGLPDGYNIKTGD